MYLREGSGPAAQCGARAPRARFGRGAGCDMRVVVTVVVTGAPAALGVRDAGEDRVGLVHVHMGPHIPSERGRQRIEGQPLHPVLQPEHA